MQWRVNDMTVAHLDALSCFSWVGLRKTVEYRSESIVYPRWTFLLISYVRSQWPRGLRRRSTSARLLELWVRIAPGAWVSVCCDCFVLSGRGLCDELVTRPEESYQLWCVVVCNLETSWMRNHTQSINVTELNIEDTSLDVFPTCH